MTQHQGAADRKQALTYICPAITNYCKMCMHACDSFQPQGVGLPVVLALARSCLFPAGERRAPGLGRPVGGFRIGGCGQPARTSSTACFVQARPPHPQHVSPKRSLPPLPPPRPDRRTALRPCRGEKRRTRRRFDGPDPGAGYDVRGLSWRLSSLIGGPSLSSFLGRAS